MALKKLVTTLKEKAEAATGMVGEEGTIFRFTLKHSILMVLVISLITLLQAYVLKWMLP